MNTVTAEVTPQEEDDPLKEEVLPSLGIHHRAATELVGLRVESDVPVAAVEVVEGEEHARPHHLLELVQTVQARALLRDIRVEMAARVDHQAHFITKDNRERQHNPAGLVHLPYAAQSSIPNPLFPHEVRSSITRLVIGRDARLRSRTSNGML